MLGTLERDGAIAEALRVDGGWTTMTAPSQIKKPQGTGVDLTEDAKKKREEAR
jgi:hypothetical protein